jgi:hypothetical protein
VNDQYVQSQARPDSQHEARVTPQFGHNNGEIHMMQSAHQLRYSGVCAMTGGVLAIVLTFPFAAAYARAYPGFDEPPFWLPALQPVLRPLLTFDSSITVYNLYGRIFEFVYLLILPAVITLHFAQRNATNARMPWSFGVIVAGLIIAFVGVAGDYWADGAGWLIELIGLLVLLVGTTLFGITALYAAYIPSWSAWLLILAGPGALGATWLIGHIPSGPTLLFAIAWAIVGYVLWQRGGPH